MHESLKVLVVGDDAGHDLSEVTNDFTARGWTPQIMRMSDAEWRLSDLDSYADSMTSMRHGVLHNAERRLLERAFYPIAATSHYYFRLHQAYTELYSNDTTGTIDQIVARAIIGSYLHDEEKSPLVAVVLTESAWDWCDTNDVWISQFPSDTVIWVMRSDGTLEIVRCVGTTEVRI